MSISKMAVKKPTTVLIIFMLLAALGIYCTSTLPVDMYPDMDIPYIIVLTTYSNAGPEEVEKSVTRTLESSLSGVSGLKECTSRSQTGTSLVIMEFDYGTNLDAASNEIRDKIDIVRRFLPDDADTPMILKMDPSMTPVMNLVVTGTRTPEELSSYVEDIIEPRLEQVDGVASVTVVGSREKAVIIDVPRDRLDAYGLTFSGIAQTIGMQNITSSGGSIESGDSNYSISAEGTYKSIEDIKKTVLSQPRKANGSKVDVLLRDIANVYEGYKDTTTMAFYGDKPSILLLVAKQSGKNTVETAKKVRKQLPLILENLPKDIEIVETSNSSDDIQNTIMTVVESLLEGIVLAVIILYIFLRSFKSTFIIALAIPMSVIITLCLMYFCGLSINMMTLSGLLLGIGMLVDNSIVILENIFSYRERDAKPEVAAVLGSEEMIGSITGSTLTTVCIFLPMIMLKKTLGMMGQMFIAFAFTIIFSLLCSLVVAAVLVPVLSSKYLVVEKASKRKMNRVLAAFDGLMGHFFTWLDNVYARGVQKVLRHRRITLLTVFLLFVASIFGVANVGFIFMPEVPGTEVNVELTMPKGTTIEATREVIYQMKENIMPELKGVKFTTTSVGGSTMLSSASDSNTAKLTITLYPPKERQTGWDSEETAKEKIRKYFNVFPGAEFVFGAGGQSMSQSAIDVVVKSDNLDLARTTAKEIQKIIKEYATDYVNETTIDLEDGLPELKINMDRNRMYELGVNAYSAGNELNAAINGKTASRYDDNGTQIDMIVRLDPADKKKFGDLEQLYVTNSMGKRIPFASFSRFESAYSPVTIRRESQTRTIRVSIKPKKGYSLNVIQKNLDNLIKEKIVQDENLIITFDGSYKDMMEAIQKFSIVIIMACCLVFAVMASQFESFKDPYIIVFTIPLSFIGVVAIYMMTGTMMNVVSIVGMLVLVGTIVNNGIVLVDYTNLLRKRGLKLEEACVEAARNRLRPILMSTLTTITSLIPMAFFPGEGGALTQPIGLTVLGGMSFGSLMTLFVMPVIYYNFNAKREKKLVAALEAELKEDSFASINNVIPAFVEKTSSSIYEGIKDTSAEQNDDEITDEASSKSDEFYVPNSVEEASKTVRNNDFDESIDNIKEEKRDIPKIVAVLASKAHEKKSRTKDDLAKRLKQLQEALADVSEMILEDKGDKK